MKRFRFSPLAVAVALIGFVSLCSSVARSQSLPLLTRSTAIAGLNDSALTLISDSAQRTRAGTTHELFKRPAGSVSRPSFSFALDSTTGIYRFGQDTIGFAAAGHVSAFVRDSQVLIHAGRVGLPSLAFKGDGTTGFFQNATGRFSFASAGAEALRVDGVRTQVKDGTAANPGLAFLGNSAVGLYLSGTGVGISNSGVAGLVLAGGATSTITGGAGSMTITAGTGNSRAMTLQTTTSAGTAKNTLVLGADSSATVLGRLVVSSTGTTCGSGTPTVQLGTANTGICAISANSGRMGIVNAGALTWYFDENGHLLVNNGSTYDIGSSGTTPRYVYGQRVVPSDSLRFSGTASNIVGGGGSMTIVAGTGNDRFLALRSSNSIGNATTFLSGSGDTLKISGHALATALTAATGTPGSICYNTATSELTKNNATSCVVSSRRFKTDIARLSPEWAAIRLMGLEASSFTYKDGGRHALGLIAENADSVDARLGFHNTDGTVNSFDQTGVIALLVATVQRQQRQIDSLFTLTRKKR